MPEMGAHPHLFACAAKQFSSVPLVLQEARLTRDAIFDLIALCRRYQIPMAPLSQIAKKERFAWLNDEKWYWYKSMFQKTTEADKPSKRTRSAA
ncbi:hypothetical protein F2P44_00005 [Massilia sp. CCM 8695]|uniref:Uncharacterized protein n=1 Tax=Massilia frigida TaxID=2609281 RepID=A0ABX0MX88_9BURK|nr:hypothetical protein [Massilia frigida]NHZ77688.1 hypothetical protein [Massilia frigida]